MTPPKRKRKLRQVAEEKQARILAALAVPMTRHELLEAVGFSSLRRVQSDDPDILEARVQFYW